MFPMFPKIQSLPFFTTPFYIKKKNGAVIQSQQHVLTDPTRSQKTGMNYTHWWFDQQNEPHLQRLLSDVCNLHRSITEHKDNQVWRSFIDRLCGLLQSAPNVMAKDKLLIWQDSFGIRAVRCGCRGKPYTPETMLDDPPKWLHGIDM